MLLEEESIEDVFPLLMLLEEESIEKFFIS
jgi:hypothetical protein